MYRGHDHDTDEVRRPRVGTHEIATIGAFRVASRRFQPVQIEEEEVAGDHARPLRTPHLPRRLGTDKVPDGAAVPHAVPGDIRGRVICELSPAAHEDARGGLNPRQGGLAPKLAAGRVTLVVSGDHYLTVVRHPQDGVDAEPQARQVAQARLMPQLRATVFRWHAGKAVAPRASPRAPPAMPICATGRARAGTHGCPTCAPPNRTVRPRRCCRSNGDRPAPSSRC